MTSNAVLDIILAKLESLEESQKKVVELEDKIKDLQLHSNPLTKPLDPSLPKYTQATHQSNKSKYVSLEDQKVLDTIDPQAMSLKQFTQTMCRIYHFMPIEIIQRAAESKWRCYNEPGYLEKFNAECKGKGIGASEATALKVVNESIEFKKQPEDTEGCYNTEQGIIEVDPYDGSISAQSDKSLMQKGIEYEMDKNKMFPLVCTDESKPKDFIVHPPYKGNSMEEEKEIEWTVVKEKVKPSSSSFANFNKKLNSQTSMEIDYVK